MATVRINMAIRKAVRRKIEMLFDKRIAEKHQELQHLDVAMQVFRNRISTEKLAIAQKLNADVMWVPTIDRLTVRIDYTGIDGAEKTAVFTAPFESPVPAPEHLHKYSLNENVVCPSMACYQPCVNVLLAYDSLYAERDTLRNSIDKLLDSCSTLRQVLEKWPTALDFMPDEVKAKHAEKVDPIKKKAKVISEVDDKAKMLLMKARMLNGV